MSSAFLKAHAEELVKECLGEEGIRAIVSGSKGKAPYKTAAQLLSQYPQEFVKVVRAADDDITKPDYSPDAGVENNLTFDARVHDAMRTAIKTALADALDNAAPDLNKPADKSYGYFATNLYGKISKMSKSPTLQEDPLVTSMLEESARNFEVTRTMLDSF